MRKRIVSPENGTVSMETPVIYFYTDKEMRASVQVDFPKGWITEWYPFAARPRSTTLRQPGTQGQSMRWDVKLLAGQSARSPDEKGDSHYYQARETDAVLVQAEVKLPAPQHDPSLRGSVVVQREKFLFYRGVGMFAPPVAVRALGAGRVRLTNTIGVRVGGLMLVAVHNGKIGFRTLADLGAGAEEVTTLPDRDGAAADASAVMVKSLTAAGLYDKEARAMVKTWDSAWFGEEGNRLLYLEPRTRTDKLLPLTIEPKPARIGPRVGRPARLSDARTRSERRASGAKGTGGPGELDVGRDGTVHDRPVRPSGPPDGSKAAGDPDVSKVSMARLNMLMIEETNHRGAENTEEDNTKKTKKRAPNRNAKEPTYSVYSVSSSFVFSALLWFVHFAQEA